MLLYSSARVMRSVFAMQVFHTDPIFAISVVEIASVLVPFLLPRTNAVLLTITKAPQFANYLLSKYIFIPERHAFEIVSLIGLLFVVNTMHLTFLT
jgi:hypothetical protein